MAITGVGQAGYTPAPLKQTLITNYIDFTANGNGWAQQYLPDLMEAEAEVFGNRTISGFLAQVGAEEAMSADQVIWSEQGRLHLSYKDVAVGGTGNAGTLTFDAGALDADGKSGDGAGIQIEIAPDFFKEKIISTGQTPDETKRICVG